MGVCSLPKRMPIFVFVQSRKKCWKAWPDRVNNCSKARAPGCPRRQTSEFVYLKPALPEEEARRSAGLTLPFQPCYNQIAGWSSPVARWAHNPKVAGSNPAPATNKINNLWEVKKQDRLPISPNKKIG